jgi:hypothetical protein
MEEIGFLIKKLIDYPPLQHFLTEHAMFGVVVSFFLFAPLGHFTIGIILVVIGSFFPWLVEQDKTHSFKVAAGKASLEVSGTARTVLFAVGALVIAGSIAEDLSGKNIKDIIGKTPPPPVENVTSAPTASSPVKDCPHEYQIEGTQETVTFDSCPPTGGPPAQ